jgi:O-antigen ligase
MELILVLAAIGAMLWVTVALVRGWISLRALTCPTLVAAVAIVVGSVFGREFIAIDLGPLPLTLDRILWAWMVVLFASLWCRGGFRMPRWDATDGFVALLMVVLTASTLVHDFTTREYLPLTRLLFFNLMPIGIYFVVRSAPVTERQLQWIICGVYGFGIYLAVTAIAEWRNIPQLIFPSYIADVSYAEFLGRARGPFLNPVVDGIFQIVGLIAGLSLWRKAGGAIRVLLASSYFLFALGVFATFTRSVWVSFAVAVALALWVPANTRQRGGLMICGAMAVALFLALFSDEIIAFKRDRNVTEAEMAESVHLRPLLAEVAWSMFRQQPIWGHGFGQYSDAKRLYHQELTDSPLKKVLPYMQHNVVLSYVTETGSIGTIALIGVLVLFARRSWKRFGRSPADSAMRTIGLMGLVMVACYFINGMFHDVSIMPMVGSLYFFLLGLNNHPGPAPYGAEELESQLRRAA